MPITATGKYTSGHIVSDGSWVVGHEDSTGDWILREAFSESAIPLIGVAMDNQKLYESYTDTDNTPYTLSGASWRAQTFTPTQSHTIQKVSLKLLRTGTPGIVTVSIRNTTADVPSGADIGSGTTDGDTLTTDAGGEWRDITLTAPVISGSKYAIVVRATAGGGGNTIIWRSVGIGTYASGTDAQSADSGATWAILTAADFMFREYGETGTDRVLTGTRDIVPKTGIKPVFDRTTSTTRDTLSKLGIKPVFSSGKEFVRDTLSKLGVSLGGYLYEYWNTGADSSGSAYGANIWIAQTFTPSTNHNIWSVRLRLCRTGSPGTVTVELYATSGGKPTTSLSCSGSTNGNTLTTDWAGEWRAINMTSSYSLVSGTQYALVVKAATGDATNYVRWSLDAAGGLANGTYVQSNDGGGTWTIFNAVDSLFEVYSTPISGTARVFVGTRDTLSKAGVKSLTDRAIALVRDPIPKIGIKPVFDKGGALVRDTLSKMGVKPVFDRALALTRDTVSKMGVKVTIDRALVMVRDAIPKLGVKLSATRVAAAVRDIVSKTGIKTPLTVTIGGGASVVYESYTAGADNQIILFGATWGAQTFIPSTAHTVTSVKVQLYRGNAPGTITASIRATSGGLPTGADLCSGTTDGSTLPTGAPYEWREITFGAGTPLSSGTAYAIVVRCTAAISADGLRWRADGSAPAYANGSWIRSTNSGVNWTAFTTYDLMFEEYGPGGTSNSGRLITLTRDIISKTGVKNIPDRALALVRDTIPKTGVKMLVDRAIVLVRDAIPKQGIKMTVGRAVTVVRDTIPKIGVKALTDRALTIVRDTIIKIGVYLDSLEIPYQTATVKAHARAFTTKLHDHTHTVAMHARSLANKLRTRT